MVFLLIQESKKISLSPIVGRLDEEYISKLDILKSENKNFEYIQNLIKNTNNKKDENKPIIKFIFINNEPDIIMGDKFNPSCESLIELCNTNKIDDCRKITNQLNIFTLFDYDFYTNKFNRFECAINGGLLKDEDYENFIILNHEKEYDESNNNKFFCLRRELSDYDNNAGKKFNEGDRVILSKGLYPISEFNETDELYISEVPNFDNFYWLNCYLVFNKTQEFGLYFHESDILQYKQQ